MAAETAKGDFEAKIAELASLSIVDYENRRPAAARALGVRTAILDQLVKNRRREADQKLDSALMTDVEPWDSPVDGAFLLSDLTIAFRKFVAFSDEADAEALALWTVHSHAHDAATVSPILALTSAEKRCGKTTTLSVLQGLVPRALTAANITAPSLFRVVEKFGPTLLIDEADSFLQNSDELRGILNSGHNRMCASVIRTVGDNYEPTHFKTWGPKAIALIGGLPDTLADRSIAIRMRRKKAGEAVDRFRLDHTHELVVLAQKAARWAIDHHDALSAADPDMPDALHDRAADNWRPLLAIADLAGDDWPARARKAAVVLSPIDDDESIRVMLLADTLAIFQARDCDRISSADLAAALSNFEDRPWPEFKNSKPITPRQIATLLRAHAISPGTVRFGGASTAKGYSRDQFEDAFARYLPSHPSHRHNGQDSAVPDDS